MVNVTQQANDDVIDLINGFFGWEDPISSTDPEDPDALSNEVLKASNEAANSNGLTSPMNVYPSIVATHSAVNGSKESSSYSYLHIPNDPDGPITKPDTPTTPDEPKKPHEEHKKKKVENSTPSHQQNNAVNGSTDNPKKKPKKIVPPKIFMQPVGGK